MPIIKKPVEKAIPMRGMIDPRAGARAAAAGAEIGYAAISAGARQSQQGISMLEKAGNALSQINVAVSQAEYSNKLNEGKLEFGKQLSERLQQTTDEDGNPTFDNLVDDVGAIGNKVRDDVVSRISDPEVRDKFTQTFNKDIVNKQLLSLGEARRQKLSFIQSSLAAGIDSLQQQGIEDDPSNTQFYYHEISKILTDAARAGAIDPKQAISLAERAQQKILIGQYDRLISVDPGAAYNVIAGQSPKNMGITDQHYRQLLEKAAAANDDAAFRSTIKQTEDQQANTESSNLMVTQLQIGMQDGTVGSQQIVEARNNNIINDTQFQKLNKDLRQQQKQSLFLSKVNLAISNNMQNNLPLAEFTDKQIGAHYQRRIQFLSQEGKEPNILQKASMAAQYKVPVKPFQHELESDILNQTDMSKAGGAVQAWKWVSDNSPEVVLRMDKKAQAVASLANTYMEHTSLPADAAIARARQNVELANTPEGELRLAQFKKIDEFSSKFDKNKNIEATIVSDLKTGWGPKRLDDDTMVALKELYQQAYLSTGDVQGARDLVKAQVKPLFGESIFNQKEGALQNRESLMFLPPEKMFPGVPAEELQKDFRNFLMSGKASINIKDPNAPNISPTFGGQEQVGVSLSDVQIKADALTRYAGQPPSYAVFYQNKYGENIPIMDKNGIPLRWYPHPMRDKLKEGIIANEAERRYQQSLGGAVPAIQHPSGLDHDMKQGIADQVRQELQQELNPQPRSSVNLNVPVHVAGAINEASQISNVDPVILTAIAHAESGLNPAVKSSSSSATGLFQFIRSTWRSLVHRYGKDYGVQMDDRRDARANAIMGALYTRDNKQRLESAGVDAGLRELYLAHFAGPQKAISMLKAMNNNPNAPVSSVFSASEIRANRGILRGTLSDAYYRLTNKVVRFAENVR